MTITRATAFELPQGGRIDISTDSGKFVTGENDRIWKSLDITKVGKDGRQSVLCAIDYDSEKGLTLKVFDEKSAESIYEIPVSF